jgi:hypothetical protein
MKFLFLFLLITALSLQGAETPAERAQRLERELEKRQQEIERLTALLTARENELRKLRVWITTLNTDGREIPVSQKEQRLLSGLKSLSDVSGNLVLKVLEMAETLRPKLNQLPLSSAERVRLTMALEDLERQAARVNAVSDTVNTNEDRLLRDVRIMSLKYELDMAVISAGALQGVFPGMTFVSADGKVHLRVLETRAMISGAVPVKGSLNELVPGSAVHLQIRQAPVEKKEFLK